MSVLREIDWSEKLPRPIKVKGRRALLKTREEVATYIIDELPSDRQHRQHWIAAATALNSGAPIKRVWTLVVRALSGDGALG